MRAPPLDAKTSFLLSAASKRGAFRVSFDESDDELVALARGEHESTSPIRASHGEGVRAYDVIGSVELSLTVVSPRFIDVLEAEGFTGWRPVPISIEDQRIMDLSAYRGLAVTGRCGPIDNGLSPIGDLAPVLPGMRHYRGYLGRYFHPEAWDGSDIFTADGSTWIIVSGRVKSALEAAKLTGLRFVRLSEIARYELNDRS